MITAILLAGGKGTRLQASTPKQFLPLGGKPLALISLEVLLLLPAITHTIVAAPLAFHSLFGSYPVTLVEGGMERQDSLYNALQHIDAACEFVLVHDAARPFITVAMVERLIKEGLTCGAATLAIPLTSTIKEGKEGFISKTLPREHLFAAQTPQLVKTSLLKQGFERAREGKVAVTDDVSLAELLGHKVRLVEGSATNIKITTPEDLLLAQALYDVKI